MSAATKITIEDAIRAHVAAETDEPGEYVTNWFLVVAAALPSTDGETSYWYECTEQARHVTLGLINMARLNFEADADQTDRE